MHKNNIKLAKTPRRLLTATMGFVFMISLSACTGNHDEIDTEKIFSEEYTSLGDISISKGDLWKELKWSADSKLEQYINNVILNEEIKEITTVLKDSGHEKYEEYSKRIVDYVVQDIYNFSYKNESFWDDLEALKPINKALLEEKYIDELYVSYNIDDADGSLIKSIAEASEENTTAYLTIAQKLSEVYYPSFAKELFARAKKVEEVNKADEEDEDADDDQLGYYTTGNYVAEFENEYVNQFDLDLLVIRFASKQEYEDTLRAFGVKVYNKQYYYLKPTDKDISYADYCDLYENTNLSKEYEEVQPLIISDSSKVLELFVEMYNYLYDGYRNEIPTSYKPVNDKLDGLRSITEQIIANDVENTTLVETIKTNNTYSHYTHKELDKISSSFTKYAYNTLNLEDNMYSTSAQSYNDNYYLVYKLGQGENPYEWYNDDLTDDEIILELQKEENKELFNSIRANLVDNDLTSTAINTYLTDELENVKVSIFDEAVEISYGVNKEGYSKTHGKAPNENVLATIEYKDVTWNFNIFEDAKDTNSLVIPGKETKYSVYNELEIQFGQTTAVDLISNECIKKTDAYKETKENDREFYQDYIEALLYNFTNEAYSSSGYPASIGKYNFLMLYFHDANIDNIIDNYYCVQFASTKLLTDYSSDKTGNVISFLKSYTDKAYDSFFSLTGKRFVVYFDKNDDNQADDIAEWTPELKATAEELINEVMAEVYASTDTHAKTFSRIIDEINGSARVAFDENPVLVENQWAKYRKAGLNVKLEDFTVTNSTYDVDKNLKDRLAAYVAEDSEYELIKNGTVPTEFIEKDAENNIVVTEDGYNILLVTSAGLPTSAKWTQTENSDTKLQDIVLRYNEEDVTIANIWNENDKLNENQIRLYVLQYVSSGSSSLTPSSISSAISSFLTPVLSRYTSDETQRIIVKYYIESATGQKYTNTRFDKLLEINQVQADNYNETYQDIYGTVNGYDQFADWWTTLETQVGNFLAGKE